MSVMWRRKFPNSSCNRFIVLDRKLYDSLLREREREREDQTSGSLSQSNHNIAIVLGIVVQPLHLRPN